MAAGQGSPTGVELTTEDNLKQVIAEWVLTNGKLPGFLERMKPTLPLWSVVGEGGMTVYRAQGGFIEGDVGGPPPNTIQTGIRPVIATSKSPNAISRYAGADCCIYEIKLQPGTRYIDVNPTVTFSNSGGETALAIKNIVLSNIQKMCPAVGSFPTNKTFPRTMREMILARCMGRTKFQGTKRAEYIPAEQEIMVDGTVGGFSSQTPIDPIGGKQAFRVTYGPPKGGRRGRTFRRKPKRSNKNGSRFTRKSKHDVRRNRHA